MKKDAQKEKKPQATDKKEIPEDSVYRRWVSAYFNAFSIGLESGGASFGT